MNLPLHISERIKDKISSKHKVIEQEANEIFLKYNGITLEDTREKNRTHPPTEWFLCKTSAGRLLKVCFIPRNDLNVAFLKTCYEPNADEIRIFVNKGGIL